MNYTSEIAELLSRHGFRRFMMTRTQVGHLSLVGEIDGKKMDIVIDTGAGKTFVELNHCRSEGIPTIDTGDPGAPAARQPVGAPTVNVHMLSSDAKLTLDGLLVRTDGIHAIDMSGTNQRLIQRGAEPIRAVIGQDVLRYHQAVIDYASLALFLKEEPA